MATRKTKRNCKNKECKNTFETLPSDPKQFCSRHCSSLNRNRKQCLKCNNDFDVSNFQRHVDACNGPIIKIIKDEWIDEEGFWQCPDCIYRGNLAQIKLHRWVYHNGGLEILRKGSLGGNSWHTRLQSGEAKQWNDGMTLETHPEFAEALGNSEDTRKKLSKIQIENPSGAYKLWLAGKPVKGRKPRKYIKTNGEEIILDSMWEVTLAKSLDKNNILWDRPTAMILSTGQSYTPDFYLVDYSIYLDPKFRRNDDQDKRIKLWENEYNQNLIVIDKLENCNWTYIKGLLFPSSPSLSR